MDKMGKRPMSQNGPQIFNMSNTAHGKVRNGPQLHPKWPTCWNCP